MCQIDDLTVHLIEDLTKDEYYLCLYDYAEVCWNKLSSKYTEIVKIWSLDKEDVIHEAMLKVLRPVKKSNLTSYERACKEHWSIGCMKGYIYRVVSGIIVDAGRHKDGITRSYFSTDIFTDMDRSGTDWRRSKIRHYHKIPEELRYYDKLDLELRDLIEECSKLKTKKGDTFDLILKDILSNGISLTRSCSKHGTNRRYFLSKLEKAKIKIEDYL